MKFCKDCGKKCSGQRCKECFIKFAGKSFEFGEWKFNTTKELETVIKTMIIESPRNVEFNNEFMSAFINKYHQPVAQRNYKVTKFKILDWHGQTGKWEFCRDRFRGAIYVLGFFEPINEWHGVTWYPHKSKHNVRQKLITSLRQKWSESAKKRNANQLCENGNHPYPQLHHDSESFKSIVEIALKEFTPEELDKGVGNDWWLHENEADAISDDHPAVKKILELHDNVKYRWLCRDCHMEEHRGKKDEDTKTTSEI